MKEISKLMDYRPDIKVIDATLRDGGLVNEFRFSDDFVKHLYNANLRAGVDYMEFGYKADREMFDETKFGSCKFCDDDYIRSIVGENNTDLKIAVMADVGRCNYKQDIHDRAESPIDLIRVATYINQIPTAVDMIENAKSKGYEVSCNIMAISNAQESEIKAALDILGKSPVDVFYIVDSFGSLYPEQVARFADLYCEMAEKYGKKVALVYGKGSIKTNGIYDSVMAALNKSGKEVTEKFYDEGTLYEGMTPCEAVMRMQTMLKDLGYYNGSIRTGTFGEGTGRAVARFQKANGLEETGIADANTLTIIESQWEKVDKTLQ